MLKNCSQLNVQNVKLIVYYEHEASDYSSAMQLWVEVVDCDAVRCYCALIFCQRAARLLPGTALQTEEGQVRTRPQRILLRKNTLTHCRSVALVTVMGKS